LAETPVPHVVILRHEACCWRRTIEASVAARGVVDEGAEEVEEDVSRYRDSRSAAYLVSGTRSQC
jgi:hypothetical protein